MIASNAFDGQSRSLIPPIPSLRALAATSLKQKAGTARTAGGRTAPASPEKLSDLEASIDQLREWAEVMPETDSLADWTYSVFHQPPRRRPPTNVLKSAKLADFRIGYYELRNIALAWDRMGPATPGEFVEAVACETNGHQKSEAVKSILDEIGRQTSVLQPDVPVDESLDDWDKWRYGE